MIPFLALLKNPLTKIIAEKTFGAINHKLEKDKILRQRELDHANNVDIQSLKSSDNSLKDEWLVIVFSLIFLAHFVPQFQNTMERGWQILEFAIFLSLYVFQYFSSAEAASTTLHHNKPRKTYRNSFFII